MVVILLSYRAVKSGLTTFLKVDKIQGGLSKHWYLIQALKSILRKKERAFENNNFGYLCKIPSFYLTY